MLNICHHLSFKGYIKDCEDIVFQPMQSYSAADNVLIQQTLPGPDASIWFRWDESGIFNNNIKH